MLEKYFQNTILFCIFKILFWNILNLYFQNTFIALFYFVFLEILLKSILPITGSWPIEKAALSHVLPYQIWSIGQTVRA